jgi:hypothetical protein
MWVTAVKMLCHQSKPVLKLAAPALVISQKPYLWGACDGGDSSLSPV